MPQRTLSVTLLSLVLLTGLTNSVAATWLDKWSQMVLQPSNIRASLPPLEFTATPSPSAATMTYFNAYGLHTTEHLHRFGTFTSGQFELAAHMYLPASPRATVILMHGFFDHTGTIAQTIHHLLDQGYAVAAYDMPGHGLSSGQAAHIEDFADYHQSLDDFIRLCQQHMPPPYHALAHSTGAAVVTTHLLTEPAKRDLDKVILVAPLVRSAFWHLSAASANFFDIFMDAVPRVFRQNSSDEAFLESVRADPLQAHQTSFEWMDALVAWNERIAKYPPSDKPLLIIQGDQDSIVDWDYNLEFLREKFPNAAVAMVPGGKHQLFGEQLKVRRQVYQFIDAELNSARAIPAERKVTAQAGDS